MPKDLEQHPFRSYNKHEWRIAGILFASYLLVSTIAAVYIPSSVELYPAFAIALGALFFGGLRLSPVVYFSAFISALAVGATPLLLVIIPIAATVQAIAGAYALRAFNVDPLFRRYWDTAYLMGIVAAISLIEPSLRAFGATIQSEAYTLIDWSYAYIANVFCFLILMPFILRWFTKPRLSRTTGEAVETAAVFIVLIGIDSALFLSGIPSVLGISLVYILLIPLFFIALRLRPRFMTLALVLTSLFAVANVFIHAGTGTLAERLFGSEFFLIVLATIFFIITSIEEELRVSKNLMLSQLATLENAVSRVSSESRAKNEFIAILAHELRNPLAPVVSAIELLKLKGPRDPEDVQTLDMMMERTGVIQRLLNDMLDISRISEGKVAFKQNVVNLESVLKRAFLSTEHHRKELHQKLIFQFPDIKPHVIGDSVRLEQIFSNLLTNASKYSNSGDTVTVRVQQKGKAVEIEVSDQGVGLSPHLLESIFIPFHQLEQGERTRKGLGIGLALVHSFVEMHGGAVTARSDGPGLGTCFTVTLPLYLPDPLSKSAEVREGRARSARKKRGALVLVVDDNDATSGNIGRLLELEGSSVLYAYQARQAIEQALSLSPDIVLINLDMRRQNGRSIAQSLRARGFKGQFVALTGSRAKSVEQGETDSVFEHYLSKPVGLSDLKRLLSELKDLAQ